MNELLTAENFKNLAKIAVAIGALFGTAGVGTMVGHQGTVVPTERRDEAIQILTQQLNILNGDRKDLQEKLISCHEEHHD